MKKVLFAAIAVLGLTVVNAQEIKFGVKAGIDMAYSKVKVIGISATGSETGFYVGGLAEIGLSDSFAFQPEILFVSVDGENQLSIPLMAKLSVLEKLDLLAGPSLTYLLDTEDGYKSFNYGLEAGASFNISEALFVEARYNIGLADLVEEDLGIGYSLKMGGFFLGLGYKF